MIWRAGVAPTARQERRGRRGRRGQSVVEFAVILPVFLLILAGLIDFGRLLHTRMMLVNASRDGARVASIMAAQPDQIVEFATNAAIAASAGTLSASDPDAVRVDFIATALASSANPGVLEPGDSIRVTVNTTFQPFFPAFPPIPVTDSIQMVLE